MGLKARILIAQSVVENRELVQMVIGKYIKPYSAMADYDSPCNRMLGVRQINKEL